MDDATGVASCLSPTRNRSSTAPICFALTVQRLFWHRRSGMGADNRVCHCPTPLPRMCPFNRGRGLYSLKMKLSGDRAMRNVLLICICLAVAYCIDRNYYGGLYSGAGVEMLRHIVVAYK